MTDGELLAAQSAYYRAAAPRYLDGALDARDLGWDIAVTPTAGPFYWGASR